MINFNPEQRILVTGASSGMGWSTALLLNGLGATVIANGRNEERLKALVDQCEAPGRMIIARRELLDDMEELPAWVRSLAKTHGKLCGLACFAGVSEAATLQTFNMPDALRSFNINYFVPMLLAQGFTDRRANIGPGSSLVFIASTAVMKTLKGQITYAGSKGALVSSARGLSLEVAKSGVRVNCISPGFTVTPMTSLERLTPATAGVAAEEEARIPFGLGKPEDVANLTVFLLSSASSWISGQNYIIDGGRD